MPEELHELLKRVVDEWRAAADETGDYEPDEVPPLLLLLSLSEDGNPALSAIAAKDFLDFAAYYHHGDPEDDDQGEDDNGHYAVVEVKK